MQPKDIADLVKSEPHYSIGSKFCDHRFGYRDWRVFQHGFQHTKDAVFLILWWVSSAGLNIGVLQTHHPSLLVDDYQATCPYAHPEKLYRRCSCQLLRHPHGVTVWVQSVKAVAIQDLTANLSCLEGLHCLLAHLIC
jgi:hypothetical protein